MPQVMSLAESRARAEQVFVMREVGMQSWSRIRDALGFKSVGAAQQAYKRYQRRNPLPNAESARAGIVERKRVALALALESLADALGGGDHQMVARLIDVFTRADAELARLYGLSRETVDINVTQTAATIIADARERLLAVIDAEVIEAPKKGSNDDDCQARRDRSGDVRGRGRRARSPWRPPPRRSAARCSEPSPVRAIRCGRCRSRCAELYWLRAAPPPTS
jgi:hypothetical protein